jgi:fatty acid desaturase
MFSESSAGMPADRGVPIGVSGDDMDRPNGNDGGVTQTYALSRPDPVRWLWYTFGGGLGPRYREWVLHDITSRTRWVRQVARTVVQVAPVGALVILVLGFGWITWVSLIGGLLLALMYSGAFFEKFAEHRLVQHGYPWGTAQRIASERDRAKDPDRMRRYMQTYRNNATPQLTPQESNLQPPG